MKEFQIICADTLKEVKHLLKIWAVHTDFLLKGENKTKQNSGET